MPDVVSSTEDDIKRLVLVADDELVNREMLGLVLDGEYEVIYAKDGHEAFDLMYRHKDDLSLVLLDLNMPELPGFKLLEHVQEDPDLKNIPIIVVTADQDSEVKSLGLGAVDFIPKPFPRADIIRARARRTIELYEDRSVIAQTERDSVTGLYNRDYFYLHAALFDQHYHDIETDAIFVDVNHFHMVNERFGSAYGDEVLRRIGTSMRALVKEAGGIVCRQEADAFLVYCPHIDDYQTFLEKVSANVNGDFGENSSVHLRMGVYANTDKDMDVERRFDRAKMAADTVRGSFAKTIGIYNKEMHEKELYEERLIDDFRAAIDEKQFVVFYQPKFDIRPDEPVLTSAEALVRWKHPELGLISPGIFIPLFEENGLIQTLDQYVWRETARQIKDWKERCASSVPVSVNVSRIDMYDPRLVSTLKSIADENGLTPGDLYLEITESAYTEDSEQIIEVVNQLRELGFKIEMDDFGTGYSSLNMISDLPIDTLKLDMRFVRSSFGETRNTRLIEIIMDIAEYLGVPVVAEGVETKEQLDALKKLGCSIVQGYYFSKPVTVEEYEEFLRAKQGN